VKSFIRIVALSALLGAAPSLALVSPAAAQAASADADITAKVKSAIGANAEFKDLAIDVTTVGGTVTLTGEVPSPLVRAKIGELTKGTEGVTKVNNKLALKKK
jgi:osmotically-inducible protein OsmY